VRPLVGVGAGVGLALLLAAAVAGGPEPAAVDVAETTPADGATVTAAPGAVDLAFTAPVRTFHVAVRDASGTGVAVGPARLLAPDRLRQPVAISGSGEVTVTYHVVSVDGADRSGTVRFGVGVAVAPGAGAGGHAAAHGHDIDPLSAVLLVVDGVVAAGAVVLLLRRPRRRPG
jgi:methionine-rich copper-binding protein CopC